MRRSENGGELRINFDRRELRSGSQLSQDVGGEGAGSRTVLKYGIPVCEAGMLNHHSGQIGGTGNDRTCSQRSVSELGQELCPMRRFHPCASLTDECYGFIYFCSSQIEGNTCLLELRNLEWSAF